MLRKSAIVLRVISRKTLILLSFLIGIYLTACRSEVEEASGQEKIFYDVRGFIETQATNLNKLKPEVIKSTAMGVEKNEVSTRDIDWTKELELFAQADINKPSFKQSYTESKPDSATYIYVSKEGDRLPVRKLTIKVDESNQPLFIDALLRTENKLYSSEKNISLQCESVKSVLRIKSYRISGFQKLATMDQKPFLVDAKIEY